MAPRRRGTRRWVSLIGLVLEPKVLEFLLQPFVLFGQTVLEQSNLDFLLHQFLLLLLYLFPQSLHLLFLLLENPVLHLLHPGEL